MMSGKPKNISIALCACKGEKYLAMQLQSLLDQTLLPTEIVIGDDSPDEKSHLVISAFAARSPVPVRYQKNIPALGVNGNFAATIERCQGDYILLSDQDDVWLPDKIQCLVAALDTGVSGAFCNSRIVDEELRDLDQTLFALRGFGKKRQKELVKKGALKVFAKRIYCSGHNLAFRREAVKFLLPFPELSALYEDSWIGLAIAGAGKWRAVNKVLTLHRRHGNNQSSSQKATLFEQAGRSKRAFQKNHLTDEITISQAVLARLDLTAAAQKILQERLAHYQIRNRMTALSKWYLVAWELLRGRYRRYSNGIKSALADLFLR